MHFSTTWRSLLAATAIFLLLSGSYELAGHWPGGEPVSATPASRQAPLVTALPQAPAQYAAPPVPLPTAAQLGYHRYVGTIGGRPVLAEVMVAADTAAHLSAWLPVEWTGSFYYRTTGLGGSLGRATLRQPGQWLETYYHPVLRHMRPNPAAPLAVLCAEQPPGPLLTGCYFPGAHQPGRPLRLRESYQDGVRYELLREASYGPARRNDRGKLDSALVEQVSLHLLGPDTVRPALARLQCPPPAARRRARLARASRLGASGYYFDFLEVTLNEGSLLAYTHDSRQGMTDRHAEQEASHCYLVDLRTGHPLSLAAQLRPGGLGQVQHLLTRQALAEPATARQRAYWWAAGRLPLPAAGFAVTPTGWRASYAQPEDAAESYAYNQEMAWASLRPLLRPDSPLHRLLRERGL